MVSGRWWEVGGDLEEEEAGDGARGGSKLTCIVQIDL